LPSAKAKPIEINYKGTETIVAIGASTGGTEAIKHVLEKLSPAFPATVITQHMPPSFTSSFAKRLDSLCKMNVHEAKDGERLLPGNAYIAPGDKHMLIVKHGADYRVKLDDGPLVSGHKPAVDVMFESLANISGNNIIATVLTGMGKDGAKGLMALRKAGAMTMAQDEASCVVYGMPKAAFECGAVQNVHSLDNMSEALSKAVDARGKSIRL